MQLWTDFLDWINSDNGSRIVTTAVIPFVAIVVAGIVAAMIGRASARKVIELSEREVRASAVTALISAARKAAVWNTLPAPEQQHIDHLIGDSEIRLRLLPIAGTGLAADWARHEIAGMKRNAISFSFQAEQSLLVFRDRLIEWQGRPSRAKRLFKNDLDSWAYDSSTSEQELVHQQQKWAAQQVTETGPITALTTSPFTRPLVPTTVHTPLAESAAAVAAGGLAASLASAAAPVAATSSAVTATAVTATAVTVTPEPVMPETVMPETIAPQTAAPQAPVAALAEPSSSSSEAALPADNEPHPLVEPADTSSHDVSEASIFGGNPPQQRFEPEQVESEHTEAEHTEAERTEAEQTEAVHAESDSEPQSSDSENIAGETGQSDVHHETPSEDSAAENHDSHDHDNHDNHDNHEEHRHDEWRG